MKYKQPFKFIPCLYGHSLLFELPYSLPTFNGVGPPVDGSYEHGLILELI